MEGHIVISEGVGEVLRVHIHCKLKFIGGEEDQKKLSIGEWLQCFLDLNPASSTNKSANTIAMAFISMCIWPCIHTYMFLNLDWLSIYTRLQFLHGQQKPATKNYEKTNTHLQFFFTMVIIRAGTVNHLKWHFTGHEDTSGFSYGVAINNRKSAFFKVMKFIYF